MAQFQIALRPGQAIKDTPVLDYLTRKASWRPVVQPSHSTDRKMKALSREGPCSDYKVANLPLDSEPRTQGHHGTLLLRWESTSARPSVRPQLFSSRLFLEPFSKFLLELSYHYSTPSSVNFVKYRFSDSIIRFNQDLKFY